MRPVERPAGRILALDLGEVRTGVAISDSGVIARPLRILESKNLLESLRVLIRSEDISEVVVGVPKTLRGEIGEQARRTLVVLNELKAEFPELRFIEWDERFTTRLAVSGRRSRGKKTRKPVDDLAAASMLQEYLESGRRA